MTRDEEILSLYAQGIRPIVIAKKFKLSRSTISGVIFRHKNPGIRSLSKCVERGRVFSTMFHLRLDPEMHEAIKVRASKNKISMTLLIREYIEWGLENEELASKVSSRA